MTDSINLICELFYELGYSIDKSKAQQFYDYYDMLIEKNKVMNLTAITEFKDVIVKHFIDSILVMKCVDLSNVESVIDVGTGAGFPGLPLKIMYPEKKIVLMDSLNKRVRFLNEVIDKLQLNNIEAVHSRAEDLSRRPEHREQYDLVVSRAVANLSTLSEYCLPFVKIGGNFISYKSDNISEEMEKALNAVKVLGGKLIDIKQEKLDKDTTRSFVIINKEKTTSKKYPRKAGTPSSEPL